MAISSDFILLLGKLVMQLMRLLKRYRITKCNRTRYTSVFPTSSGWGTLLMLGNTRLVDCLVRIEFEPSMLSSDPSGFHHNSPYGWDVRDQILIY